MRQLTRIILCAPLLVGCTLLTQFWRPLSCGDGLVSDGEQCDEGANTDGDGCDSLCQLEVPQQCEDATPLQDTATDTNEGAPNENAPIGCAQGDGPELAYVFTPPQDGLLDVLLQSSILALDKQLLFYIRTDCSDPQSELLCSPSFFGFATASGVPVVGAVPLFVIVDGASEQDFGDYTLQVTFSSCGDGTLNGGEQCDDGNQVDGDGCESDCTITCDPSLADRVSLNTETGGCLLAFNATLDWQSAEDDCITHGGHLASIGSAAENALVAAIANGQVPWIGGNDLLSEASFVWSDGEPLLFTNFAAGEPNNGNGNEDCLNLLATENWNDVACTQLRTYICETP